MNDDFDYHGPERRKRPQTIEQLEVGIVQMLRDHEERERDMTAELRKEFFAAFPNGDIKGHCDYHDAKIRAAQAEERFWESARTEALKHGVAGFFAVLKFVAILSILSLAYKVGVGPLFAKLLGVAP